MSALCRSMACEACGRVFKSDSALTTHQKKFCPPYKEKRRKDAEEWDASRALLQEMIKAGTLKPDWWKDDLRKDKKQLEQEEAKRLKKAKEDLMTGELPPLTLPERHFREKHDPLDEEGICKAWRRRKVLKERAEAAATAGVLEPESNGSSTITQEAVAPPEPQQDEVRVQRAEGVAVTENNDHREDLQNSPNNEVPTPFTYFDFDNISFNYDVQLDFSDSSQAEPPAPACSSFAPEPTIIDVQYENGDTGQQWENTSPLYVPSQLPEDLAIIDVQDENGDMGQQWENTSSLYVPSQLEDTPSYQLYSESETNLQCGVDSSIPPISESYTTQPFNIPSSFGLNSNFDTFPIYPSFHAIPKSFIATTDYPLPSQDNALWQPPQASQDPYCYTNPLPLFETLLGSEGEAPLYMPMGIPSDVVAAMLVNLHVPFRHWADQSPRGGYVAC
ncbi:hypothetical protein D9611_011968 [Ephemerocybe angulata]|uniref:C2H2-type domain-containing protein n=1 Tax=Ephemerocybe angulata TaxID=980116 RepID=A0A8H5C3R5_9AGAR|nr:hypothetical protein D9611_011968 [Tulosesus angulatus]